MTQLDSKLELPETNVIIRDGKVYAVTETELPASQLLSEIREFYKQSYDNAKKGIVDENFKEYAQERQAQLHHIEQVIQRNKAFIPQNLYGKPVMYFKDTLCELTYIRYKPNLVTSDTYRLKESVMGRQRSPHGLIIYTEKPGYKKIFDFVKDLPDESRVVISLNQNLIDAHQVFAYSEQRNLISTPFFRTFHTMSALDLCTGDTNAKVFWNSPDFPNLVNRVNLFSLATETSMGYDWTTLLKDEYVTDIKTEVLWRT